MGVIIPEDIKAMIDQPIFVHVAVVTPDGAPHSSVLWITRDGDLLRFSTAEGRVKATALRHEPRVSISFTPPDDSYRSVTIQGRVVGLDNDGKWLIDRLAKKYLGTDEYPYTRPGEVRLNVAVEVERVAG